MFSIANLLDRAKEKAGIESDYRLAKVIAISHGTMSGYRCGKSMPDERVLEQLCALSGDDLAIVAAQVQAERARTSEGKTLWLAIAARLASDRRAVVRAVSSAILSAFFAIGLIATGASDARASGLDHQKTVPVNLLYIVSNAFLTVTNFIERRSWRNSLLFKLWIFCAAVQ